METQGFDTLLDLDEVAAALRLPVRSLRYIIRRGDLPAVIFPSGQIRIEPEALAEFIARCRR